MKLVCLKCKNDKDFVKEVVESQKQLIDSEGGYLQSLGGDIDTQEVVCKECESTGVIDTDFLIEAPNNILLTNEGNCWRAIENAEDVDDLLNASKEGYLAKDSLTVYQAINALNSGEELRVLYKDFQDYEVLETVNSKDELKRLFGDALYPRIEQYYVLFKATDVKPIEVIKNDCLKTAEQKDEAPTIDLICLKCGESEDFESELNVTKTVALNSLGQIESVSYSNEGEFSEDIKCASCGYEKVYNAKEICEEIYVDMMISLDKTTFSDIDGAQDFEEFYQNETTYIPRESALTLKEAFEELKKGKELVSAEIKEDEGCLVLNWIKQLNDIYSVLELAYPIKKKDISFHRVEDLKPISMLKEKLQIK